MMKRKVLVLLAGQSNMSGRGYLTDEDVTVIPQLEALRWDGVWIPAADPFNYDRLNALGLNNSSDPFEEKAMDINGTRRCGVGPGRTFGRLLLERMPDCEIGLVPVSVGGTPIAAWFPGGKDLHSDRHPFDDAVKLAKQAQECGDFTAILWHQGETDGKLGTENYKDKLIEAITTLRKTLGIEDVPVILGGLGTFLREELRSQEYTQYIREAASELPNAGYVSAEGLTDRGDKLHFDTPSQHELGIRYFAEYCRMTGI